MVPAERRHRRADYVDISHLYVLFDRLQFGSRKSITGMAIFFLFGEAHNTDLAGSWNYHHGQRLYHG
jgi:hypothetical protein